MNIHEFIRKIGVSTLVEIGVHFGEDTRVFRDMCPNARIVGFEPDPRNVKIIRETGIDKLCEFHAIALSDKNETREFHMSSGDASRFHHDAQHRENDWSSSSSLKRPTGHLTAHPWITFPTTAMVECRRLDDIESLKMGIIDFIWVDVQGAEDIVFSGAKETLTRTRYVYTEYATGLYEGQLNRDQLIGLFGNKWSVVHDFGGDILLKNMYI
jgi:FkbM family methyltransferase